ncbi:MAG: hypothetical protein MUF84_13540 [Anaerolineae bacterium]|nr:hypothetical protein [Anaerolineae bacterium]
MKRFLAASTLILLGILLLSVAATGAAAQTAAGTCRILDEARDCTTGYAATSAMFCEDCLSLTFPDVSWESATGSCLTQLGECSPTAVTFLNIETPITACNASWTVPGVGLLGIVVAVGGLGLLKRGKRA